MGIRSTNSIQSFFDDFFEAQVTCSMTDVWAVRYQKGDQQTIHNHKSWGFTGILYVDFDPKVAAGTTVGIITCASSKKVYIKSIICHASGTGINTATELVF